MFCTVILAGCATSKYRLFLVPRGDEIQRKLRAENISEEELQRIEKAYPELPTKKLKDKSNGYFFEGTFTNIMPQDIGGAGWYLHYETQMGSTFGYFERFRGLDDLFAQQKEMEHAADTIVNYLIGWFEMELGKEPNFDQLRQFLDRNVRRDIKNLAMYFMEGQIIEKYKEGAGREMWMRIYQYLAERNYFDPLDMPRIYSIMKDEQYLKLVQEIVAKKLKYDSRKQVPVSIAFLSNHQEAIKSLSKYLSTTPKYQAILKEWNNEKKTKKDAPAPDPMSVMTNAFEMFANSVFSRGDWDSLEVDLATEVEPYETNGKWKKESHSVKWSLHIENGTIGLPTYCYACWSRPNESFQKAHFGKMVLSGSELGEYCLWRKGLTEKQGKEWDAFVLGLQPGKSLIPKLNSFAFSTGARTTSQPAGSAKEWLEKIVNVLEGKTTTTQATTTATVTAPAMDK